MSAAFDTLAAARRMEGAGMDRAQAEAVAETVREAGAVALADLATKADLAALEARLTWRMVVAMTALLAAQGALIVALIKLLP